MSKKDSLYLKPIHHKIRINAPSEKVWDIISSPGNLEYCHPFCESNPVDIWPGKESIDYVNYYNGLKYIRKFTDWNSGIGYELVIGKANEKKSKVTIENSAPNPAPTGAGTYQIHDTITLGGQVSDFDGDTLYYEWLEGDSVLFNGSITTLFGGGPITLPDHLFSFPTVGNFTLKLEVSDSINDPVSRNIFIEIKDSSAPTLSPIPNKTILWPPNHKMVEIVIEANALDNSGYIDGVLAVSFLQAVWYFADYLLHYGWMDKKDVQEVQSRCQEFYKKCKKVIDALDAVHWVKTDFPEMFLG